MQEVSGSIPLGSTNLCRFAATVGKPLFVVRQISKRDVAKRRRLPVVALAKTGQPTISLRNNLTPFN